MSLSPLCAEDARIARLIANTDALSAEADADGDPDVAELLNREARQLEASRAQLASARPSRTLNAIGAA